MEALQGLNCPAFNCLKIREHLFYVAEVEASGRSATVSSTVGFHCHAPHRARGSDCSAILQWSSSIRWQDGGGQWRT